MRTRARWLTFLALCTAGCAVGPNYTRPTAPVPANYKELNPAPGEPAQAENHWKTAQPQDAAQRGKWWEIFGDTQLNALEEQVDVNNQNIAQAEAQYRGARAAVRGARADFFPTVTATASATRGKATAASPGGGVTGNDYVAQADLSWEADVWGRIRRNVEANVATAQASAADLETMRLSMHAELASDYFQLRGLDAQKQLLDSDVVAFEKALQLTVNRFNQGVVSGVDVAQAQTLLETTRAQSTDLGVSRAQFEHAIAILIGKPPADFALEVAATITVPPDIPIQLPSNLLERRSDISGAERRVAAANAQVGVTVAAFFPQLLLAASGGYESSTLSSWFTLPSRFWSIGPSLVATLFDGGKRRAATDQAIANYDATVAAYRLQVLTAFQNVEDSLAALRILELEAKQEAVAVQAAEKSLALAKNRYEAGITTYLEVITAQSAALSDEVVAINILTRRMTSAVNLVQALGGGWDASQLPYGGAPPPPKAADAGAGSSSGSAPEGQQPR